MESDKPTVLLTGGAGFIGSHLAETLVKRWNVRIIDNLSSGRLESISHLLGRKNVSFAYGDIRGKHLIRATL